MKNNPNLINQIKNLPHIPGCYLYKDEFNNLIYVGKAKDLKKRVSNYLTKVKNTKTQQLVGEIAALEYISTSNEKEALILEQTLIKEHHPKYNILLADDKQYPYIQITNDKDPQYKYVRRANKDQGKYFGPFPDGTGAREIMKLLERIFPLRKCRGNLGKPCLYYHIGQCSGACFKQVLKSYYDNMITKVNNFFQGEAQEIKENLLKSMRQASANLQFEQANRIKLLLEKIDMFLSQQLVEFQDTLNRDFINFIEDDELISIVVFFYRNGKLQSKSETVFAHNGLDIQDLFRTFCLQLYNKNILPNTIYLPKIIEINDLKVLFPKVKFIYPQKGDKEYILNIVKTNAIYALQNYFAKNKVSGLSMMKILGQWLNLPKLNHLEIFDVSNWRQTASIGAMIVYKGGEKSTKDYRHYILDQKLKSDYHRFGELIYRRYFRILVDRETIPDLIIVDGGRPQITATLQELDKLKLDIPVIGLIKNNQHQTAKVMNQEHQIINIPENDPCFTFLTVLQDQIHNYAIKYHKLKRSQSVTSNILASIPGIGPNLQKEILKTFSSVTSLTEASEKELAKVVKSKSLAKKILLEFNSFK